MHRFLILNWKLNPATYKKAQQLLRDTARACLRRQAAKKIKQTTVVACPPFQYLCSFIYHQSSVISHQSSVISYQFLQFGAQDCFWESNGSYTGEVSPLSLHQAGIRYVILGHSERTRAYGETDEMIGKKIIAALQAGLRPIVCVGEDKHTHIRGKRASMLFVTKQLHNRLYQCSKFSNVMLAHIIVVYEPSWAISTVSGNVSDDPADAAAMIGYIKDQVSHMGLSSIHEVLYGGSVHAGNIEQLAAYTIIDGFLVGHASLYPREIQTMIAVCEKV